MSTCVPLSLLDRLTQTHASETNRLALLLWDSFVGTVVKTLREAEVRLREPSCMARYSARIGWWRRRTQKNNAKQLVKLPSEDAITEALIDLLEEIRNEAGANDPIYAQNLVFTGQQPRKTQNCIGPKSLTTDIRAFVPGKPELDLRIEAKILFKEKDLASEYCADRGICRFGDPENPYTDQIIGAMLGYSLTPSPALWYEKMERYLGRMPEVSNIGLAKIFSELDPALVCDVIRQDGSDRRATVLHLLMEFDTEPPSRGANI